MKYKAKSYFKIPGGEIQYGHVTHRVTIWFLGRCWHLWRGNLR